MKIRLKNTKLTTADKTPIVFYHTTPFREKITSFHPLTHFGTQKAAEMRTIHYMYQRLGIPEPLRFPDKMPPDLLKAFERQEGKAALSTYAARLFVKSPVRIPDLATHSLTQYHHWFAAEYKPKSYLLSSPEWLEGDAVGAAKTKYKRALTEFIFVDPFTHTAADLKTELSCDHLYSPPKSTEKRQLLPAFLRPVLTQARQAPFELAERVSFQRLIRFLEGEGHDGFVYRNECEDKGHDSYIIFRPEQVFDIRSPEVERDIPPQTKDQRHFLYQAEHLFFQSRGMLSPTDRIIRHANMKKKSIQVSR